MTHSMIETDFGRTQWLGPGSSVQRSPWSSFTKAMQKLILKKDRGDVTRLHYIFKIEEVALILGRSRS